MSSLLEAKNKIISISTDDVIPQADGSYRVSIGKLSTQSVIAISLRTLTMRNIFYNIISLGPRKNNIFKFSLDGMQSIIEIPSGYYSITELLAYLKDEISAVFLASGIIPLPTLTELKYVSIKNKVEITVNGEGSATEFSLDGEEAGIDSVNYLLGNWENVDVQTLTPIPYLFENQINLAGLDGVYVVSNRLSSSNGYVSNSGNFYPNGRTTDLLAYVPLNVGFGGLVVYRNQDLDASSIVSSLSVDYTSVKLSLEDSRGRPLYLDNSSVNMELIAWLA